MSISRGSVKQIITGTTQDAVKPILQVTSLKSVALNNQQRYRCTLTDGQDSISGMINTQLNPLVANGSIQENCLVHITGFIVNEINGQKALIIIQCDPVGFAAAPAAVQSFQQSASMQTQPAAPYQPQQQSMPQPMQSAAYGGGGGAYGQQQPASSAYYPQQQQQQQRPAAPYAPVPASTPSYGGSTGAANYGNSGYGNSAYGNNALPSSSSSIRGGGAGYGESHDAVVPIAAVNPYSNKWTIKARITNKSDIRQWSNAKGEGKLFSIDLLDNDAGEIRGTFFKESCDKFYGLLEQGKVYFFSGGQVKVIANKQYNTLKNNYEVTFNERSDIRPCSDQESQDIKAVSYHFTAIDRLQEVEPNTSVDILAVVRAATDISEIQSQKMGGKTLTKRELTLIDASNCEVRLTLWGEKALLPVNWTPAGSEPSPIVALKGVKVGDYGGRSLSMLTSSHMDINPSIPEAFELHTWRSSFGGMMPAGVSLSSGGLGSIERGVPESFDKRKSVSSIVNENLGGGEKPDYLTVKGSVVYIKFDSDPWYTACPTAGCNKKVLQGMSGDYRCEKCDKSYPSCNRRYVLQFTLQDTTGTSWVTAFNEHAEKMLGRTADELFSMREAGESQEYEKVFSSALFKAYIMKLRVKKEMVNDEARLKAGIQEMFLIDYVQESKLMIDAINKYK